ncbi:MAG: NAD-dependent epimerase/dehydratase family protein [Candidatus Synoicihabitans palmerolidicus]|nr:NAD-dependent epimerase/dehydratase family protein [Candidatus Synoicihabitans palmerolidicus]
MTPPPITPTAPVLVTGGTGFLGSHLVERLVADGRAVTVVSRQPRPELSNLGVRVVVGALHETGVCADAVRGVETVYHVAARVGVWDPYEDFHRDNVTSTETLLAAARQGGVRHFVHTSTPSVVYNGRNLANADESLPLTHNCPSPYPLTKAIAERAVLAANSDNFLTTALRPHLIWGIGDPHLVPRILARARLGRLRIVGSGQNLVDMVHIQNATDAHLAAEFALHQPSPAAAGHAYFITNDEPVNLWEWINQLLTALGEPPLTRHISLASATRLGTICETLWNLFPLKGEPPMTRFVAAELAKDHWFNISAAKHDLGYQPRVTMAAGTSHLISKLNATKP